MRAIFDQKSFFRDLKAKSIDRYNQIGNLPEIVKGSKTQSKEQIKYYRTKKIAVEKRRKVLLSEG